MIEYSELRQAHELGDDDEKDESEDYREGESSELTLSVSSSCTVGHERFLLGLNQPDFPFGR